MDLRLEGKRILVTGGNSGIGAAIVRALAGSSARVAINYLTHPEANDPLISAVSRNHGEALAVQADISDLTAVAEMFRRIDAAWSGIDILINNAGIDGERAPAWDADMAAWRKVIEVNLFGTFHCSREALKRMTVQRSGVILNISSVHEEIAWSGYSAYAASRAAVSMLGRTLAQEAAPFGIRVLSIAPGAVKTPINRGVWSDPHGLSDLKEKIPLGRMGEPEEIAQLVVVLISDIASYVTGCTVVVDGGMTDYPAFAHGG